MKAEKLATFGMTAEKLETFSPGVPLRLNDDGTVIQNGENYSPGDTPDVTLLNIIKTVAADNSFRLLVSGHCESRQLKTAHGFTHVSSRFPIQGINVAELAGLQPLFSNGHGATGLLGIFSFTRIFDGRQNFVI